MVETIGVRAAYASLVVYRNVMAPMRDGTRLATDIYLPSLNGNAAAPGRFPVILSRSPYGKSRAEAFAGQFTARGYAFAYQDKRGRFASQGVYRLLMDDGWGPHQDGFDTIEWLARQPWCDGRVGMMGNSYLGFTTIAAAVTRPPHLFAALCSQPSSDLFTDRTFQGGALSGAAGWNAQANVGPDLIEKMPESLLDLANRERDEFLAAGADVYKRLPLTDLPFQRLIPTLWANVLAAWDDPSHFAESAVGEEQLRHLGVPVLQVGGWYDPFIRNNLRQFRGASSLPPDERVRAGQRLIVGPWTHGGFARAESGETHFPDAAIDMNDLSLAWHDAWRDGAAPPQFLAQPVLLYVMGENRWRAESAWPPADARPVLYYLHSAGRANGADGDGVLSTEAPGGEPGDHYRYDPRDPVSYAGVTAGRNDYSGMLGRDDILVYTSAPLEQPLEVTGEISATIYASSSALDTDWTVELHDVDPQGRSFILAEGILRARYRRSRTHPQPLVPGSVERYDIDVRATSNVFLPGHRIRVLISSSKFPRYDRNPNAYVNLAQATEKDWQVAQQTVLHSREYPSCIVLPVVPREREQRWVGNPMPAGEPREFPTAHELPGSALSTI